MMESRPKLRHIEPLAFREDGQELFILRDPASYSSEMLIVTPDALPLLALLDGSRTPQAIAEELAQRFGGPISAEAIEPWLRRLDEALFLENDRFREHYRKLTEEFRQKRVRAPFHAGVSYPRAAAELAEELGSFYTHPEGAGLPGNARTGEVRGLIAPHIDLRLGGPVYTHAYRALAESSLPDLFVILGTGHAGLPELFSISEKSFQTPLGQVETDGDFAAVLRKHIGDRAFGEDLTHRTEHTIEFQTVFLQHLLRGRPFRILPVLTSFSFQEFEHPALESRTRRLFDRFVEAMIGAAHESGKRICFIASIDLAHIGPRYGDGDRPDEARIEEVLKRDQEMLTAFETGSAGNFFRFVREEQDSRRICGFSPLYTLLTFLPNAPGEILAHSHAVMDASDSFVSFAGGVIRDSRRF